ncbi:TIGR02265 family protein [Archangium sp.]|uniref:TIGR02265 family protein n=1 Tax=Archangium sp. TaxID=1872627 RepID=UPI002ED93B0B
MGSEVRTGTASPCGWERDLAWRLSQAAPEDTVRGVFFNGALAAVRELGDAEAVRCCLEASGEERFLDYFSYPLEAFLRLLACAARKLRGRFGCMEGALRELGRHANADFLASPVGRAAVLLASGSPRRMMDTVPDLYRQSWSFGAREVVWTGPSSGRVRLHGDLLPSACHEGVLEALLRAAGGRGVRVAREWTHGLDGEYAFSWE